MLSIHARKPHRHFVHSRSWRCPLPPDSPTGTLSTLVAEAVLQEWKELRNRIACSDVAGSAVHPDFSYGIAHPATCRPPHSPVHA